MSTKIEGSEQFYSELTEQGDDSNILISNQDPITLYNKFIKVYNLDDNKVNGITLNYMISSKVVQFIHNYLRNYLGIAVFLLILILLPFINLLFYILLLVAWIKLTQNYAIFQQNIGQVMDPFANMIENQDLCEMMKKNYVIFNMELKENEGLHFSTKVKEMIKNRSNGNNKIKYTIYNQTLKEQFYGYPNSRITYLKWILVSTVIVIIQITLMIIYISKI
ncbi:unnamed protein product (macronuclear) [Paramecium tetraurelia]|uniref:Autophagy-related protein 9 n=1 Tax=Paramecium tetraurelia TaxID=5888 RepID=A0C975_PARTE|nr:uncharacterized protein GSPATT00006648001 [Paramecium tetraurelia]CAK67342.1 unnamed protein product [Paramecium tetraurelia]|eukprot:XP_001434739.1 hypothetical protein (macronuclear) [Paramecium tetraurelia strain d4-2]